MTPLDDSKTSIPASMHARRSTHTRTWHDERMPEMTPLSPGRSRAKWTCCRAIRERPASRIVAHAARYVPCTTASGALAASSRFISTCTSFIEWPWLARICRAPAGDVRSAIRCFAHAATDCSTSATVKLLPRRFTCASAASSATQPSSSIGTLASCAPWRSNWTRERPSSSPRSRFGIVCVFARASGRVFAQSLRARPRRVAAHTRAPA